MSSFQYNRMADLQNRKSIAMMAVLGLVSLGVGQTVYDESKIGAWAYSLGNFPFNSPYSYNYNFVPTVPFGTNGIVGLTTMIFSDGATAACPSCPPEVFNIRRQAGRNNFITDPPRLPDKYGSRLEFFRFNPGSGSNALLIKPSNNGDENFFTSSFPFYRYRTFSGTASNRGVTKAEYICPGTCPPSTVSSYWYKLGAWDMYAQASMHLMRPAGINTRSIVDMSATIHSDGGSAGFQVDNLEHLGILHGSEYGAIPGIRGRGGMLWYGVGCGGGGEGAMECQQGNPNNSVASFLFRLYAGSGGTLPNGGQAKSVYRGYIFRRNLNDAIIEVPYRSKSVNRGWFKFDYTGSPITQPSYVMKTKAVSIGPWNMGSLSTKTIPLNTLGINANRITHISAVIQSDPVSCGPQCWPGSRFTDFQISGNGHPAHFAGGLLMVDGSTIRMTSLKRFDLNSDFVNFFSTGHNLQTVNGSAYNRGWVKVDYLAGSCEQGPSGFTIRAIPGTRGAGCSGTTQPFSLEGSGQDIWNSNDDFTYSYKSGTGDRDLEIKVESMDYTDAWARVGIMFRASLNANSAHASMVITPAKSGTTPNGARFTYRLSNGVSTNHSGANTFAPPYFIRIKKVEKTFTAYYRPNTSSNWTQAGIPQTINDFQTTYYYGLAQTSKTGALNKATFSGMTMSSTKW